MCTPDSWTSHCTRPRALRDRSPHAQAMRRRAPAARHGGAPARRERGAAVPSCSAQLHLQATQLGNAADPVFWNPLNRSSSWLFKSFQKFRTSSVSVKKAFDGGVSHRGFPACVDCSEHTELWTHRERRKHPNLALPRAKLGSSTSLFSFLRSRTPPLASRCFGISVSC